MKLRPHLPRIKTSNLHESLEVEVITPTIAHYKPPVPAKKELPLLPQPPSSSRLTFLAIWDPESEEYTLPCLPREHESLDWSSHWHDPEDEGFFDTFDSGHPDCEPHLHSRFSTSTTSTSNFIQVSQPHTPMPFLNHPAPRRQQSRPEISGPFHLLPSSARTVIGSEQPSSPASSSSHVSLTSLLSRRPRTRPATPIRSFSAPASSVTGSTLNFLKRRTIEAKQERSWVYIDVERVINVKEREVYV